MSEYSTEPQMAPATLYIVDDDHAVRSAIALLAYSLGWRAYPYGSAKEFLSNYQPTTGDCLILDLRMPGMNGAQLLEELGKRGHAIPAVVITAHRDDPLVRRAETAGAHVVMTKPFRNDSLVEQVNQAMAAKA